MILACDTIPRVGPKPEGYWQSRPSTKSVPDSGDTALLFISAFFFVLIVARISQLRKTP